MPASFSNAAGSITFTYAPLRPTKKLSLAQSTILSSGGIRFGFDYYYKDDLLDLPLRLTTVEVATFLTFWREKARGMAVAFTYTDTQGATLSVQFADNKLPNLTEKAYGVNTVTVSLRVQ